MGDEENLVTVRGGRVDEDLTVPTQPTERPERTIRVAFLEPLSARGTRIPIGAEPIVLGRSSSCTVKLKDLRASSRHTQLQATDRGVIVSDLGSRNGTFVDGQRVDVDLPMRVTTTATLTLGRTKYRILVGDDRRAEDADESLKARSVRFTKDRAVDEYERNGGNLSQTASFVGFDRHTVRDWLRERDVYREPEGRKGPTARTVKR